MAISEESGKIKIAILLLQSYRNNYVLDHCKLDGKNATNIKFSLDFELCFRNLSTTKSKHLKKVM